MNLKNMNQFFLDISVFFNNFSNEGLYYKIIIYLIFASIYILLGFIIRIIIRRVYNKFILKNNEFVKYKLKYSFRNPSILIYWSLFSYLSFYLLYFLFYFENQKFLLLDSIFKTIIILFISLGIFNFVKAIREEFQLDGLANTGHAITQLLLDACYIFIPFISVFSIVGFFNFSETTLIYMQYIIKIMFIVSISYLLVKVIFSIEKLILNKHNVNQSANLKSRTILTQVSFLRKILIAVIIILAVASILMVFDTFRQIGTSLLASAGVATVIVGFAAQKTISNLFAGLQLAFSQPIRLYDVVVVEGEWGKIEEITLTYVVVAIWDQRRLVLPISYFNEKPFQNWTKKTSEILGTVFIYADYSLPISVVEAEVAKICNSSTLWDRRVCVVQITNMSNEGMEIRILVSSIDSGTNFDLRCLIRRKIIEFMQTNYPACFPNTRLLLKKQKTE